MMMFVARKTTHEYNLAVLSQASYRVRLETNMGKIYSTTWLKMNRKTYVASIWLNRQTGPGALAWNPSDMFDLFKRA